MNLANLLVLYLLIGVVCAVAIHRSRQPRALLNTGLGLLLWPLWAPVLLSPQRRRPPEPAEAPNAQARIDAALAEGVNSTLGTPLHSLLNAQSADRILAQVQRVDARREELRQLLERPEFSLDRARERARSVNETPQAGRGAATARLHLDNVERLHAMLLRDGDALEELADLMEALRSQLLLARYTGSSAEGIGAIVNDLWARVEGLGEAMELDLHDDGDIQTCTGS